MIGHADIPHPLGVPASSSSPPGLGAQQKALKMNRTDQKTKTSGTWALFESGHGKKVKVSLSPLSGGRPVEGFFAIGGEDGGFTRAARRAALSVYESAKAFFPGPVSVAYDLEDTLSSESFTGESAGLAFVVALAKRVYKKDPAPVAATGVIGDVESGAVKGVEGITAKLDAAMAVLPEGGWVLFPEANDKEIGPMLREKIEAKGLRLKPVSSVPEALDALFPGDRSIFEGLDASLPGDQPKHSKKRFYIGVFLLMACVAATAIVWMNYKYPSAGNEPVSTPVVNTIPGEASIAAGTAPPSTQKPETVIFTGDTPFASKAADLLIGRVKAFLKEAYPDSQPAVSGAVTMARIIEETDPVTGRLLAEVELALKDLVFEKEGTRKSFEKIAVRIKGEGPAGGLITAAVSRLTEEVKTRLSGRPHTTGTPAAETKPDGGKGFD